MNKLLRFLSLTAAVISLLGCATQNENIITSDRSIVSDALVVNYPNRIAELNDQGINARVCDFQPIPGFERFDPQFVKKKPVPAREDLSSYYAQTPLIVVASEATAWRFTGNMESLNFTLEHLKMWAEDDFFVDVHRNWNVHNALFSQRILTIYAIVAWDMVKNAPEVSNADRTLIIDWLKRLMKSAKGKPRSCMTCRSNNHAMIRAVMLMLAGVSLQDSDYYDDGLSAIKTILKSVRSNGMLYLEARRGGMATFYTNLSLSNLVTAAEIALHQGDDLYSYDNNAISRAVNFFLNAFDDPNLIIPYAKECYACRGWKGEIQRKEDFMQVNQWGVGWMLAYIKRFPEESDTQRLKSIVRTVMDQTNYPNQPFFGFSTGGNASCYWASDGLLPD